MKKILIPILFFTFVAQAQAQQKVNDISQYFNCEGNLPYTESGELRFSALASRFLTRNGSGWRNELSKKQDLRKSMYETSEALSGTVSFFLSPGSKTIFVQYHDISTGTILKVCIADTFRKNVFNGIPNDGIFDIFMCVNEPDGVERTYPFLAIESGSSFEFTMENECGDITVSINGMKIRRTSGDSKDAYLKFGDYLQAQDPATGEQEKNKNRYGEFYEQHGMQQDELVFTGLAYESR